jgi:hypothetical protein
LENSSFQRIQTAFERQQGHIMLADENSALELARLSRPGMDVKCGDQQAGALMIFIWQPQHKGFGAFHWHSGNSVADDGSSLFSVE